MLRKRLAFVAIASVLPLGCGPSERPWPSLSVAPAASRTSPGLAFDDSAIATVAETIADGQAARARVAMRHGNDARVRRFAAGLDADLPAVEIAAMQLGPRSSVVDDELTNATDRALRQLDLSSMTAFDRTFVASEQESLALALRVLDVTLIPKAADGELARRLSRMRAVLAEELSRATALAGALPAAP